jgi:hypothetical protein
MKTKLQELKQLRSEYRSLRGKHKESKNILHMATDTYMLERRIKKIATVYNEKKFFWLPKIKG